MNKVAAYKEAIIEEALNKIAKEKKEKRPNAFNANKMVKEESLGEYTKKDRRVQFAKGFGGAIVGGALGAGLGNKLGSKVANKVMAKGGDALSGMAAKSIVTSVAENAGQIVGVNIATKKDRERRNEAELNATKRLADKLYGDNKKVKDIATKKPRTLLGENYATNLVKAERAYKKEMKKNK